MSEVKKIATRESYGNALVELGKKYENLVVLDADLAGATKTGIFQKAYPERHIDCGIAESNMMGIAAGLSTTGKVPFASTFAMFAAGRAYEQVRNSIGYPHLNVKIGATHAGISVGEDGATHQCNEDMALMRTIPGMVIGIAFLFTFSGTPIQNTFFIIVICNVVHFFSTPYLMMKSSLAKMNASWETTALLMGDSWL